MPITFFVEPERELEPVALALSKARTERLTSALRVYRAAAQEAASGQTKPLSTKQQSDLLSAMETLHVDAKDFSCDIEVSRKIAETTAGLGDFVQKASAIETGILQAEAAIAELQKKLVLAVGHVKVMVLAREALADTQGGVMTWKQLNARLYAGDGNLAQAALGRPTIDQNNSGSFLDMRTDMIVARPDGTTYGAPERRPA